MYTRKSQVCRQVINMAQVMWLKSSSILLQCLTLKRKKAANLKLLNNLKKSSLSPEGEENNSITLENEEKIESPETEQDYQSLPWRRKRKTENILFENRKLRWKSEQELDISEHSVEVSDDESSETIVKRRKAVENRFSEEEPSKVRGNRIVDLNWLAKMLEAGCEFCGKTPLLLSKSTAEYRKGFVSTFKATCDRCSKLNAIRTQKPNAYRNPEDLNSMAVIGTLHNGIGVSHLQSIMAAVEVPSLSVNGYKNVENYVGKVMKMEAEHSCMQAGIEEKILSELKGQSGESVSIDQGWQRRGAAMNSMSGHSSMIGELSKKVISYDVRVKGGCRTCLYSYENKQTPKDHDCRVNHDGSSKSMESASAVSMLKKAIDKGLNIIGLTTDEDSSTHAKYATEIPSNTRRRKTDVSHCKKSITKRLYKLKNERCFLELNPKSISYFGRCFAYSIRQNKGNESKIRKAIEAIVPHAYGGHNKCNSDSCRYLRNPETFIYRHLPAGKPLRNPSLKI